MKNNTEKYSFKKYLLEKPKLSIWTGIRLPRWINFLFPLVISFRRGVRATYADFLGFLILEVIFVVFFYIRYLFKKRKLRNENKNIN